MRIISLTILLLFFCSQQLQAQVSMDSLIGTWRLSALEGKKISESELLKKYSFSSKGYLTYLSSDKPIYGKFTLQSQTGSMLWQPEGSETVLFQLKLLSNGTLQMKQVNNTGATGILTRVK